MPFLQFWDQCLEFYLSSYKTYQVSVIRLLFGIVSGINKGVSQEGVFLYEPVSQPCYELVVTGSTNLTEQNRENNLF